MRQIDPLACRELGRSGVSLPLLGIGTVPLGNYKRSITDADAQSLVEHCLSAGIRSFDTAPLYGSGLAESRLGRGLAGVERSSLTISTKVGRLLDSEAPPDPSLLDHGVPIYKDIPALQPVVDFSRDGIRRSLDESMRRLRTDRIDIVHLHDPEGHEREVIEHAFPALEELRGEGVISAIGVGTTDVGSAMMLVRELPLDCILLASRWTLLDRSAGAELLPTCDDAKVDIIAAAVFNSGILANPRPGAMFHYRQASDHIIARARAMTDVAAAHSVPLAAAALQFPLLHPTVAGIVVGVQSPLELDEDLRLVRADIPSALWLELDEFLHSQPLTAPAAKPRSK